MPCNVIRPNTDISNSNAFTVGAVGNCQALQVAIGCCFAVAIPATSLLFFFRVRAIFNANTWMVAFFAFLWLAVLGGSWTVPFAIQGGHIGPTDHCINTGVKPFSSAGIIISTVNDTVIFIAISWRLLETTTYDDLSKDVSDPSSAVKVSLHFRGPFCKAVRNTTCKSLDMSCIVHY